MFLKKVIKITELIVYPWWLSYDIGVDWVLAAVDDAIWRSGSLSKLKRKKKKTINIPKNDRLWID